MEENISLLKILLQEKEYPQFTDEELQVLINQNKDDIYKTAAQACMLKANADKKITVGPITIEGPGSEYWTNLSSQYTQISVENKSNTTNGSGFKTRAERLDR